MGRKLLSWSVREDKELAPRERKGLPLPLFTELPSRLILGNSTRDGAR